MLEIKTLSTTYVHSNEPLRQHDKNFQCTHTYLLQCSRSQLQDLVSGLVLLRGQQTVVAMVTQTLSTAHGLTALHAHTNYLHV